MEEVVEDKPRDVGILGGQSQDGFSSFGRRVATGPRRRPNDPFHRAEFRGILAKLRQGRVVGEVDEVEIRDTETVGAFDGLHLGLAFASSAQVDPIMNLGRGSFLSVRTGPL
jgi:hypothetical protein